MLKEFLLALQFLTIIQVKKTAPFDEHTFGRSAAFFPLIGIVIGALVWGIDRGLAPVCPPSLQSLVIVTLLTILSRGLHADGLADSADGLFGGHEAERRLAIMKDSRVGTFGVLALLGVTLFKIRALDVLTDGGRSAALFLGPTLSRWAYVVIAYRAVPARPGGLGSLLVNNVFFRELVIATGITLSVSILCDGLLGPVAMTLTLLWVLRVIAYCTVRLGGVTGDIFGAVGEVVETTTFCLFAVGI